MAQVNVVNIAGEVVRQMDLDDYVFGVEPNPSLVHQAVVAQLANARKGTADTRTRGEVNASGSKLWRQKGTGRARQGSRRAPHWKGGGIAFGPHPRSYAQALPRKMRRLALRSALSSKVAEERLLVLDRLDVAAPRTREMAGVLKALGVDGKAMIVLSEMDETVRRATNNLREVLTVVPGTMNLLDILSRDRVVMTADAVDAVTRWLGKQGAPAAEQAPKPAEAVSAAPEPVAAPRKPRAAREPEPAGAEPAGAAPEPPARRTRTRKATPAVEPEAAEATEGEQ